MVQCASIGTYGAMALHRGDNVVAGDFGAGSIQYEYLTENVKMTQEHSSPNGTRGTRSRHGGRNRTVAERISGPWTMEPTPTELQTVLEIILGGAPAGNVYSLAELLPKFGLLMDKVAMRYVYSDCLVSRATFSASQKGALTVQVEVEGKSETKNAAAFSTFGVPDIVDEQPYILADSTLTLNGITTEFKSFSLVIDNVLDADRFMNSITRECIPATDRIVTLSVGLPFNATTEPLHDLPASGLAGQIAFAFGASSTVFDMPRLQVPADTPATGRRATETMMDLKLEAKSILVPNDELTITHQV
jgi:hypothetical protein